MDLRFTCEEIRVLDTAAGSGSIGTLVGYASVFDSPSEDLGGFREIIKPGAFRDHLSGSPDVRALMSHDPDRLLGRTSSNTLRLSEDSHGLRFENDIPDTSDGRDLMVLAKRKDIRGMSFGFRVAKGGDSWAKTNGAAVRTISAAKVGEVSYVASPAYPATGFSQRDLKIDPEAIAAMKSLDQPQLRAKEKEFEEFQRKIF